MHSKALSTDRIERQPSTDQSRLERLIQYADNCESAKKIAESIGDTFLAYMMSMAIQAARLEMKPKIAGAKG